MLDNRHRRLADGMVTPHRADADTVMLDTGTLMMTEWISIRRYYVGDQEMYGVIYRSPVTGNMFMFLRESIADVMNYLEREFMFWLHGVS
jgi:hypothetical protein